MPKVPDEEAVFAAAAEAFERGEYDDALRAQNSRALRGEDAKRSARAMIEQCSTDLHEALSDWAESDEVSEAVETSTAPALRGRDAEAYGREQLARASGRLTLGHRRATGRGYSPRRQVRLDAQTNERLDADAARSGRTASAIIRAALAEYLPA